MRDDRFARVELDSGLVVLTEKIPGLRSVSLGIWVRSGSVQEKPREMGASHLLEHMVFKGTKQRSALDIALALERLGGSLDAYTTREHTAFQARVLDEHMGLALDLLVDLVRRPLIRSRDLDLEREVVLEEISVVEDTPDDLVFDLHASALWGDHPYGYSILGTRETVSRLSADDLRRVYRKAYSPANMVVAAVGSVDHEAFVGQVAEAFDGVPAGSRGGDVPLPGPVVARQEWVDRSTAQTHLVMGRRLFPHRDPRRIPLVVLSTAVGGGMSSRLFQRVREELGLAYSVFSFQCFYREGGVLGIYLGTRHEWADRAARVISEECRRLADHGLNQDEFKDAKGQVKGQLVLSLESSSARLARLAGFELYDEDILTLDDLVNRVDAITPEEMSAIASEFFDPAGHVVLRLGPGCSPDNKGDLI